MTYLELLPRSIFDKTEMKIMRLVRVVSERKRAPIKMIDGELCSLL